jgi:hypothetical protein
MADHHHKGCDSEGSFDADEEEGDLQLNLASEGAVVRPKRIYGCMRVT